MSTTLIQHETALTTEDLLQVMRATAQLLKDHNFSVEAAVSELLMEYAVENGVSARTVLVRLLAGVATEAHRREVPVETAVRTVLDAYGLVERARTATSRH
jgi:hypothetical protein